MKFIPHEYQKYCIDRMISDDKLGLMLDMGLGKTIITLSAIADLKFNRFEVGKVLIIAPKKSRRGYLDRRDSKVGPFIPVKNISCFRGLTEAHKGTCKNSRYLCHKS